jgi:saccharopepsin
MSAEGVWVNEYGSRMSLAVGPDGAIAGTYESTTGSTGKYRVVGYQQPNDPTSKAGQALALAIHWHSIVEGPADASWHWSSALGGQISLHEEAETMVLSHALVVTDPFPGLAPVGTYIDKLTYKRVSKDAVGVEPLLLSPAVVDPLARRWRSADGTMLDLVVTHTGSGEFGCVSGRIVTGGLAAEIAGVTDIKAASGGVALQSVAITARLSSWGPVVSLSGSLDLQGRVLKLLDFSSLSTAPDATYLQTRVAARTFTLSAT